MALKRWRSGRGFSRLANVGDPGAGLRRQAGGAKLSVAGRLHERAPGRLAAEEVELSEGG